MDRNLVENIRIKLASGLYDKHNLWLDMKYEVSHEDFELIAEFIVDPEVREDLKARIDQLGIANKIFRDYQSELQKLVLKAEAAEISGSKHYPYQEQADFMRQQLELKILELPLVSIDELRKFYTTE